MTFRTYHEVDGEDRSGLGAQVATQRARVAARMHGVRRSVAVMSGKGGVGKSYFTAAWAVALAHGRTVGVLDADLGSPTVARLLNASGRLAVDAAGVHPVIGPHGVRVMSTDLILDEAQPLGWKGPQDETFVWRGALGVGVLREMLADVVWTSLDALLIDLPPGADGIKDLRTLHPGLTGAIAITIPSEESYRSVARALHAAMDAGVTVLGVVENMSGYACPDCGKVGPLFPGDAGTRLAGTFGVPLLGRVPFRPGESGPPQLPADVSRRLEEVLA